MLIAGSECNPFAKANVLIRRTQSNPRNVLLAILCRNVVNGCFLSTKPIDLFTLTPDSPPETSCTPDPALRSKIEYDPLGPAESQSAL